MVGPHSVDDYFIYTQNPCRMTARQRLLHMTSKQVISSGTRPTVTALSQLGAITVNRSGTGWDYFYWSAQFGDQSRTPKTTPKPTGGQVAAGSMLCCNHRSWAAASFAGFLAGCLGHRDFGQHSRQRCERHPRLGHHRVRDHPPGGEHRAETVAVHARFQLGESVSESPRDAQQFALLG